MTENDFPTEQEVLDAFATTDYVEGDMVESYEGVAGIIKTVVRSDDPDTETKYTVEWEDDYTGQYLHDEVTADMFA